ncbi:glycosyltransferase [Caballeronia cordobensis]|uniref:glycosyltransferase n=1 Tax=Caballeronia cordobensis TaxID=1353886 RepID=UPI0005EF2C96
MKLGIYCDSGINGGHEEMLKRFMLALVQCAHVEALHILVPTANEPLYRYVSDLARAHPKVGTIGLSYTTESIHGNVFTLLREARATAATLRGLRLNKLLIAQGTIVSGIAGLLAGRQARTRTVSYLPLVDEAPVNASRGAKIKWLVKRALYRVPHEYVTLNDHLCGKLSQLAPNARAMILENYVDDRFSRSTLTKDAARAALGLPDDGTTIVAHIGRLNFQQKRQDFLMHAIERHADAFARTLVLIVGEGPDEARLQAMIDASPTLSACVRLVGPKKDVLPYIVASDALVLPSAYEGVPLVMIEAVLAQRPIVVSRVSGLDSYLPDALLFPANDHDAFVERIFAARDLPLAGLAGEFRRRFSREVFDAQAQNVLLHPGGAGGARGAGAGATHQHSDVLAK